MLVDICVKKTFRLAGSQPIQGWTSDHIHVGFESADFERWLAAEKFKWFYSPSNDVYIIFPENGAEDEGDWVDSARVLCEDGKQRILYLLDGENWHWQIE